MIRPVHFGRNSETVADNSFQDPLASAEYDRVATAARAEFDVFVNVLTEAGVRLTVVEDRDDPITPDAVFCNNWFSTHDDGLLVTYPMYWPQRRRERRADIIELFDQKCVINRTMALDHWENDGRFLESTGSLVLDRVNRVAYACISNRCDENAVHDWCEAMDYQPITFKATDAMGRIVYHNNVIMAIGTWLVPICLDAIADEGERAKVKEAILVTGRRIMELTPNQVEHFAGNMLEADTASGGIWIMSTQAYTALTPNQRALLRTDGMRIAHAPIETIETYGGGSARCMVGEIFLADR